jgi:hypothetical protein
LAAALAFSGCRSPRSDLVEAELRTRERQLRELEGELLFTKTMNEALENTLRDRQCVTAPSIKPGFAPSVKDIQLGRGTSAIDNDSVPGDEAIQVVLTPRDVDASPVKIPGTLKVAAFEITPEGLKAPLSSWDVPPTELRRSWRTGLLSTGYHVSLPFQRFPQHERARIVVTFLPLEGGVYEAERDVRVLLPPSTRPCPPPGGLTPPTPSEGPQILPPPQPIHPTSNYPPAMLGPPRGQS